MIPSYTDHAANERTFLAWIRTGLTIMALGFVIERLDLFLAGVTVESVQHQVSTATRFTIHAVSIALLGLGIFLIAISSWRFVAINRAIEAQDVRPFKATALPLAMALGPACRGRGAGPAHAAPDLTRIHRGLGWPRPLSCSKLLIDFKQSRSPNGC